MWNCGCGVHQIVMCPLCRARAEWKKRVLIIISGHKEIQPGIQNNVQAQSMSHCQGGTIGASGAATTSLSLFLCFSVARMIDGDF